MASVIPLNIIQEYQSFIPASNAKKSQLSEEEISAARVLADQRKAFLKAKAQELGVSAQKLEKDITKALKKTVVKTKPVVKEQVKEEDEVVEDESSSTTLKRELTAPDVNFGRGGYYVNSPEILAKHLKETGGKWRTRFPPEPNGYLHIGHAKAMLVSFGTAALHNGQCILRFDDTNPEAEKTEFIEGIIDNVKWLGHTAYKITYTSDYFEDLYQLAKKLILIDKAYVCHQTPDEVKKSREFLLDFHAKFTGGSEDSDKGLDAKLASKIPAEAMSPFRNRPIEESLELFEQMRNGMFAEGAATLRMKQDLLSPNANMWDQMAYRILYKPHPRTGDSWCIYPTYDFSHCLVDSIENVTHSLCSLEFESRQSTNGPYHWILYVLNMYHPQTWEFSRCSISSNVMSKRRLNLLVTTKSVLGWNDPRLLTLNGLRRRGFTPAAINSFCESIGVARSSNDVTIKHSLLEHFARKDLNENAKRKFAIPNPIKIRISNFEEYLIKKSANGSAIKSVEFDVPDFPQDVSRGSRKLSLSSILYIPRHKFRTDEEANENRSKDSNYKGLVKGGFAKLMNAETLLCEDYIIGEDGNVEEILCKVVLNDKDVDAAAQAQIPWVSLDSGRSIEANLVEVRLYDKLFTDCEVDGIEVSAERAAKAKGKDFMQLLNKESLLVEQYLVENSVLEELTAFVHEKSNVERDIPRWQFITFGYFCYDQDSTDKNFVLNRIVSLKESKTLRNL